MLLELHVMCLSVCDFFYTISLCGRISVSFFFHFVFLVALSPVVVSFRSFRISKRWRALVRTRFISILTRIKMREESEKTKEKTHHSARLFAINTLSGVYWLNPSLVPSGQLLLLLLVWCGCALLFRVVLCRSPVHSCWVAFERSAYIMCASSIGQFQYFFFSFYLHFSIFELLLQFSFIHESSFFLVFFVDFFFVSFTWNLFKRNFSFQLWVLFLRRKLHAHKDPFIEK